MLISVLQEKEGANECHQGGRRRRKYQGVNASKHGGDESASECACVSTNMSFRELQTAQNLVYLDEVRREIGAWQTG
jgi:hypothetical protein